MAGLPLPSIQSVTAKVHLSQSSVLGNIFLEDTQVSHGVSDMINFMLSKASQAEAVSPIAQWRLLRNMTKSLERMLKRNIYNIV